jgi:hypothetical protein
MIREEEIDPCAALGVSAGWSVDTRASYHTGALARLPPMTPMMIKGRSSNHFQRWWYVTCAVSRGYSLSIYRAPIRQTLKPKQTRTTTEHVCTHARMHVHATPQCVRARARETRVRETVCVRAHSLHTQYGEGSGSGGSAHAMR